MTALLKRSSRNLDNDRKDNSKIPKSMKYKSQNRYVQNGIDHRFALLSTRYKTAKGIITKRLISKGQF